MQKARRHHISWLRPLVGARVQGLFHPLLGVLFTFPSRYWFTIGLSGVFSLARRSWRIQAGFLVSRPTRDSAILDGGVVHGAVTLHGLPFQVIALRPSSNVAVP